MSGAIVFVCFSSSCFYPSVSRLTLGKLETINRLVFFSYFLPIRIIPSRLPTILVEDPGNLFGYFNAEREREVSFGLLRVCCATPLSIFLFY